ncbi:hypothetical protein L7F22_015558, partial [Adiantum nelumboides]|nr:hypothetical protein [Adiantum nelumboides]
MEVKGAQLLLARGLHMMEVERKQGGCYSRAPLALPAHEGIQRIGVGRGLLEACAPHPGSDNSTAIAMALQGKSALAARLCEKGEKRQSSSQTEGPRRPYHEEGLTN